MRHFSVLLGSLPPGRLKATPSLVAALLSPGATAPLRLALFCLVRSPPGRLKATPSLVAALLSPGATAPLRLAHWPLPSSISSGIRRAAARHRASTTRALAGA